MNGPVIRAFDAVVDDVNMADRTLVAKINTCGKDRYNTVISPRGGSFEAYRRNPVVLWEHGKDPRRFTDPIGRNGWIKPDGGDKSSRILAKTRFLEDEFSQQRLEWYNDGTLSAFSVSALPKWEDSGPPTPAELRGRPDWEGATNIFRSWELAEYSGTAVPGNADTLVAGRAATLLDLVTRNLLWLPDEARGLIESRAVQEAIEEYVEPPAPTEVVRTAPYIDTDGQSWTVRSATGVKIATFADEKIAEICLTELGRAAQFKIGDLMSRNHSELMGQFDEIRRDLKNEIALRIHGVV